MKKWLKRIAEWGGLSLLVIYAIDGVILESQRSSSIIPKSVGVQLAQDPALVADAQQLGIDYSPLNMSLAPSLSADDVIADQDNTTGTFQAPNTIKVKSGQTRQDELRSLAYEYLHYVWENMRIDKKQQLTALLQQYYDSSSSFRQLNANYMGTPDILADERNSVACTYIQPYLLTDDFNSYCDHYIPNRSILFP